MRNVSIIRCLDYNIRLCNELHWLSNEYWYFGRISLGLLISSKLLYGLKMSDSKILCSVKIGQVSISIPSMFIFDFCEEMKLSCWYTCDRWRLSRLWRIFEMQRCAPLSLPYHLDNESTSHIIWFGLSTTEKVYPRSSCAQFCTMEIHKNIE